MYLADRITVFHCQVIQSPQCILGSCAVHAGKGNVTSLWQEHVDDGMVRCRNVEWGAPSSIKSWVKLNHRTTQTRFEIFKYLNCSRKNTTVAEYSSSFIDNNVFNSISTSLRYSQAFFTLVHLINFQIRHLYPRNRTTCLNKMLHITLSRLWWNVYHSSATDTLRGITKGSR